MKGGAEGPEVLGGYGGMLPQEIFEIWSVCDAFFSILAKKLRLLKHC